LRKKGGNGGGINPLKREKRAVEEVDTGLKVGGVVAVGKYACENV